MAAKISLIAAIFYSLAIALLSLVRLGKISVGAFNPTDKLLHGLAYFLLVVLWKIYFILKEEKTANYKLKLFKIAAVSIAFGIFIEVLQGVLTNYRELEWYDMLANTTGVLLAVVLFLLLQNHLRRLKSKICLFF